MTRLYDAYGNPVDTRLLKQELAAPGLGSVRQVISDHPSSDITPKRLANLLRASECGDAKAYLELAEDMEVKYLHYAAQLRTRKLACAGLDVVVKAAGDSKEAQEDADLVRMALDGLDVSEVILDALDGLSKGYSVLEIIWNTQGKWLPGEIKWRDPRWFRYDIADGTTLLMLDGGLGVPLAPYKFIYHRPRLKSGLPIRGGLAIAAAWSFLFSNYVLKDWVSFCEVFGQPIRVGKFPAGASEENISVLKYAVNNIGTDCSAVIPAEMMIEFVEAATKNATGELYERLSRYLDERVTVAILGQTLTSGQTHGGGGSLALGRVHEAVRYDLLEADARQLSATLSQQLARPIVDLNLGPREVYPKIELFIKQNTDLTALADQLAKLVPLGLRVDAGEVRDKFGLSDPPADAEVLAASGDEATSYRLQDRNYESQTEQPDQAVTGGATAVQDTALNGAQVSSLLQVLEMTARGVMPKETAIQAIKAAFPGIDEARIRGMVDPIEVKPARDGWDTQGQSENSRMGRGSCGCAHARAAHKKDTADVLTDQLEEEAADGLDGLLEPVRRLVAGAKSYEEILDGILSCYPDMDVSGFAQTMKDALVAANLAGHSRERGKNAGN